MIHNVVIYRTEGDRFGLQVTHLDGRRIASDAWPSGHEKLLDDLIAMAAELKSPEEQARDRLFEMMEKSATDEQILTVVDAIPFWTVDENYTKNQVRRYPSENWDIYRCVQDHKSQAAWTPDKISSLWVKINEDEATGAEIIEWFEPTAEHNYSLGQLVRFTDGKVYESLLNNNVWSPSAYPAGWKLREDLK